MTLANTATVRGAHGAMITRVVPRAGPEHYRSFSMRAPLDSHWRPATCEEVECEAYRSGWVTTVDTSDALGQRRYHFITHDPTRRHSMQHVGDSLFKFVFGPGQECFNSHTHRAPIGRPALLLVGDGDWRGNPRGTPVRQHTSVDDFVDEFSNHQDRLLTALQRG
jgi:hypothetical protein